jgi:hypothetical protein
VGLAGQQLILRPTAQGLQPAWFGNSAPVFSAAGPKNLGFDSAICGVFISNLGKIPDGVSSAGILFSRSPINSTAAADSLFKQRADSSFFYSAISDTASKYFMFTVKGLKPLTKYYFMPWVRTDVTDDLDFTGNHYPLFGNQLSFTTPGPVLPVVTVSPVTPQSKNQAIDSGRIISDGGSPILASGLVWSTSPNPDTTLATKTRNGSSIDTGSFAAQLTGLTPNTTYYVRAYAANKAGISYSSTVTFNSGNAGFYVGEPYQGGIIYYVDPTGQHGLIAALADVGDSTGTQWWNGKYAVNDISDTATVIGKGAANTSYIISAQGTGIYAASIAKNYSGGGYSDWYLPDFGEMRLLMQEALQKTITLPGFNTGIYKFYWTSSETPDVGHHGPDEAAITVDSNGKEAEDGMGAKHIVRPIRSF